ncbi:adenylate kinase [Strigomonas culicis]|uniref:Adenylate kinase n=1 Tax=Strigomonas culicis TaxID=28005 RepID=S9U6U5_9TRYP|nr:adenylate kinase [Strigomonas culicis]|eukprot:EPY24598.1 adenylate kinase [Strigomonas culicis]
MAAGNISDASLKYFEEKKIKSLLEEAMHDLLLDLPQDPLTYLLERFDTPTSLRLIVSGPPGSGKGTQCDLLARAFGLKHISVGDILRQAATEETERGKKIALFVTKGTLVPDDLFVNIVIEKLREAEQSHKGWLLDGFPRTRAQAIYLQKAGISPQRFFYIDVSDEISSKRLLSRRGDATADKTNRGGSDRVPAERKVSVRMDDTPDVIGTRLKYFAARKNELVECYAPFYVHIDGSLDVESVFEEIKIQVTSLDVFVQGHHE